MLSLAVALLLGSGLASTPGWETLSDPALGVELLRPTGWSAEALRNGAVQVRPPAPLQGRVLVLPVPAAGAPPEGLVDSFARSLEGTVVSKKAEPGRNTALVRYAEPGSPEKRLTALVAAVVDPGGAALYVLAAPDAEIGPARPALAAIAQSVRTSTPEVAAPPAAPADPPLAFERQTEPSQSAFSLEVPTGWRPELSAAVVNGEAAYVKAGAVLRSPERHSAFVHYKLATFPLPKEGASAAGAHPYAAGSAALERCLFPLLLKAPELFSEPRLTARSGLRSLYSHPSGFALDGEAVEYTYRYKGEPLRGGGYVVTWRLPAQSASSWFLYGFFGWEAPAGGENTAKAAAVRLLESFTFEGRYAPQADSFWKLAREAALEALKAAPSAPPASATPSPIARLSNDAASSRLERAALSLLPSGAPGLPLPPRAKIAPAFAEFEGLLKPTP